LKRRHDSLDLMPLGESTRKIGTLQHFRWLRGIVACVMVLNLFDAVCTITVVSLGKATEANPLMAGLIDSDPWLFMVIKLLLVSLGSYLLWRLRKRAAAVMGIFAAFMVYYCLALYHLAAMTTRLF
jgi:hypothetical protein